MKTLTALFTALVLMLGLGVTAPVTAPEPLTTTASAQLTEPTLTAPPVEVPPSITAPDVQLTAPRVEVTVTPAPTPITAPVTAPNVAMEHPPLTPEFIAAYPVYYSPSATCPIGTAMAMDNACLPLHYWNNPVPTLPEVTACMEDMPCWDCSTMGNRICGTEVTACPATWYLFSDGVCIDPATVQQGTSPVESESPVVAETALQETPTVDVALDTHSCNDCSIATSTEPT